MQRCVESSQLLDGRNQQKYNYVRGWANLLPLRICRLKAYTQKQFEVNPSHDAVYSANAISDCSSNSITLSSAQLIYHAYCR